MVRTASITLLLAVWGAVAPVEAQTSAVKHEAPAPAVVLHHAPISVASATEPLRVVVALEHPELVRRLFVVYGGATGRLAAREFRRGVEVPYLAEIPVTDLIGDWIGYCIELESIDGSRTALFASRAALHRVQIQRDRREEALARRLGGRRSVFSTRAEYVDFGTSEAESASGAEPLQIRDRYFRIEGGYTYRPLGVVNEFSLRIGVVRGKSPVPLETDGSLHPSDTERFDVGLNYGAPSVRFRLLDWFHLETELLTSVTEVGFSVGAGAAVAVGDPYGTKLVLGFESVQVFGTRMYSRLDVQAARGLIVSPIIEVTDMPHADEFGVRLIGEAALELGAGFSLAARGGYQARAAAEGGPSFGGSLGYAF